MSLGQLFCFGGRGTGWTSQGESISKEMERFLNGGRGWRTILPTQLLGACSDLGSPTPHCFPIPCIYHSTEDALLGNRHAEASWFLGLWPLVPTICMVCWEINKHTNTKGKFCEVPVELTLSGQGDGCNECLGSAKHLFSLNSFLNHSCKCRFSQRSRVTAVSIIYFIFFSCVTALDTRNETNSTPARTRSLSLPAPAPSPHLKI